MSSLTLRVVAAVAIVSIILILLSSVRSFGSERNHRNVGVSLGQGSSDVQINKKMTSERYYHSSSVKYSYIRTRNAEIYQAPFDHTAENPVKIQIISRSNSQEVDAVFDFYSPISEKTYSIRFNPKYELIPNRFPWYGDGPAPGPTPRVSILSKNSLDPIPKELSLNDEYVFTFY